MAGKSNGVQETPQQAAMVQRAQQQLADYEKRWLPVQQKMAAQIQEMGEEDSGARMRAKGRAATETAARFGQAQGAVEKSLTNSGRGPGSAAFGLGVTGMAQDAATSKGAGMMAADQAIDDAYVKGLGALTQLGRGEKATAMQGESQLAAMSGRQAIADAQMAAADRAATGQIIGYGMGAGMNAAMQTPTSNVPQSALNRANASADPIGSLNSQMNWTN